MTNTEDTEVYYQHIVPAKAPAIAVMTNAESLHKLGPEGRGAPEWFFLNVTDEAVTVKFATSVFSAKRSAFVAGPDVRIVWAPGETIGISATLANNIHQIIVSPGGAPLCVGGQAPTQLVRTSPKADYEIHPSLRRDPAAERAAITRPKNWARPEESEK